MKTKQEVREYVWKNIERFAKFPPPWGRIPNFIGAERACEKLRELDVYKKARIVFSAPDSPLRRAREIVLKDGKILLAVKPKMTGFLVVERGRAGTIKEMMRYGKEVRLDELNFKVDLFLQGCVAVDRKGNRIGKGSGFGDKEFWLLKENDLLAEDCLYVVVAHPIQIFDDLSHLMDEHDVKADVILTPSKIIWTEK
jgi:5-formyltetrahydrofolate cyclo-ligase